MGSYSTFMPSYFRATMKKTHLILLILVAAAVAVIFANFADFSSYETFASAAEQPGKQFHVIGYWEKGKPSEYDPEKDPNRFRFWVKDKAGAVHPVVFSGARPTDIEKSEQIVMTGHMQGDEFRCNKIQMKCPSKYKNDQIALGT